MALFSKAASTPTLTFHLSRSRNILLRACLGAGLSMGLVTVMNPTHAGAAACGETEKKTPIYKAYQVCAGAKNSKDPEKSQGFLKELRGCGYCSVSNPESNASADISLKSACQAPSAFVCHMNKGKVFNSQCQLTVADPREVINHPDYVSVKCDYQVKEAKFFKAHQGKCRSRESTEACQARLRAKYHDELSRIERELAYTPARVLRLKNLFSSVKAKYLELVEKSALIRPEAKPALLANLKVTELRNELDDPSACANTEPTGPATGIFYNGEIEVCIGAMSLLDHMDDSDLLLVMGHELSHSIDPCTLEENAYREKRKVAVTKSAPENAIGMTTYPGLVQCLRGGKGPTGCSNSVLHCNTSKGIKEYCSEQVTKEGLSPNSKAGEKVAKQCLTEVSVTPTCPLGKKDPDYNPSDLSAYRKDSQPVDQIQETFSDFMGAEVLGALMQDRAGHKKISDSEKLDGLSAIAVDISNLHGGCQTENTTDLHPPGFLRVDRVMMGSQRFREAFCSVGAPPPSTAGAGMSCKGL